MYQVCKNRLLKYFPYLFNTLECKQHIHYFYKHFFLNIIQVYYAVLHYKYK